MLDLLYHMHSIWSRIVAYAVNKHARNLIFDLTEPCDDLNMRRWRIESDYEIERWFLSWNVPATKQMKKGILIHYEITFDCGSHFQTRSQFHSWSDLWVIDVTQTRFILTRVHLNADIWIVSGSWNVFKMAVCTKTRWIKYLILYQQLIFSIT